MKSRIILREEVQNIDRRFGSNQTYYPVMVIGENREEKKALFSESQIEIAILRAERNPEDIPDGKTFWQSIFGV